MALRRALKMDEITGGAFSISNLGMYGVRQFDAIINAPQCAILAVGAAISGLIVTHGAWRIGSVLRVTLSVDHRIIDGATAATFLASLRALVERPDALEIEGTV
jgi:pyruvate dehydrogenase E2 component (dihydrolipoamide acetyltransferase)